MPTLFELESFGKRHAGLERFTSAKQRARANSTTAHPVFDWARKAAVNGPTLAFDLHAISERMHWLADAAAGCSVTPLLAVKSCTFQPCLELAHQYLGGYDISNFNEYSVLPENLQGKLVSLTTPVLPSDLGAFKAKGNELLVTLDSTVQLEQFFAQQRICDYVLRVKGPDLLHGAEPADPAFYPVTRFGFSLDEVTDLLQDARLKDKPPAGFHVHHGSEVNRLSTFRTLVGSLASFTRKVDAPVKFLNIGGGWHRLAQSEIVEVLSEARLLFPHPCKILIEPGRWYSESAGYAVGTVVNLSLNGDILRCTLDLSARCHLHWSNPTLLHFADPRHDKPCVVQFYGASCYESDLIGKYMVPYSGDMLVDTGLALGSQVIFGRVSTYSAQWNTLFNGIPVADVEWVKL